MSTKTIRYNCNNSDTYTHIIGCAISEGMDFAASHQRLTVTITYPEGKSDLYGELDDKRLDDVVDFTTDTVEACEDYTQALADMTKERNELVEIVTEANIESNRIKRQVNAIATLLGEIYPEE